MCAEALSSAEASGKSPCALAVSQGVEGPRLIPDYQRGSDG
jgi:hypothetical protein